MKIWNNLSGLVFSVCVFFYSSANAADERFHIVSANGFIHKFSNDGNNNRTEIVSRAFVYDTLLGQIMTCSAKFVNLNRTGFGNSYDDASVRCKIEGANLGPGSVSIITSEDWVERRKNDNVNSNGRETTVTKNIIWIANNDTGLVTACAIKVGFTFGECAGFEVK